MALKHPFLGGGFRSIHLRHAFRFTALQGGNSFVDTEAGHLWCVGVDIRELGAPSSCGLASSGKQHHVSPHNKLATKTILRTVIALRAASGDFICQKLRKCQTIRTTADKPARIVDHLARIQEGYDESVLQRHDEGVFGRTQFRLRKKAAPLRFPL